MQQTEYTIGIDIGGTNTSWGLVDRKGTIHDRGYLKTHDYPTPEAFVNALAAQILPVIEKTGREKINGIGIGAPSANYYSGEIFNAPNLPWQQLVPLKKMSEATFHLHTTINNDANATAIGEQAYGAAKGLQNFIVITLGTGLGSGILANGQMIYGHSGLAGELGHTIAIRNGRPCGCGRNGCLEKYASATGIVTTAMEMLQTEPETQLPEHKKWLRNIYAENGKISSSEIYEAAVAGDDLAVSIFNYTGTILGQSLADVIAITEPEAIIFFGGLAKAGDFLLEPTQKAMEENLLFCYKNKVKLILSGLNERDAAILGAAGMGWL